MQRSRNSRSRHNQQNRVLKWVAAGCVAFAVCFTALAGGFLYYGEIKEQNAEAKDATKETLVKETEAISAAEANARVFLNQPAPEAVAGDNREVIRIVEVIPHEACSVFPYLLEWGSKEEYDNHTALGFEGIRYLASKSGLSQFGDQGIYNLIRGGITSDTLKDYSVNLIDKNSSNGATEWWRETQINNTITASGYFEYVGENKGLYNINLTSIIEADDTNNVGIRYDIMAMERKGSETPKGEWQVNSPAYYWSKKAGNTGYPTNDITGRTDYNYDLKFTPVDAGTTDTYLYRANQKIVKLSENQEDTNRYDYMAVAKDQSTWTAGYSYWDKGNYTVSPASLENKYVITDDDIAGDKSNLIGKYIRIADKLDVDNTTGLAAGYFRLFNIETDKEKIKVGDVLFDLSFENVTAGQGDYVLTPSAVNGGDIEQFTFDYLGENKGTCDVAFIYASRTGANAYSGILYTADITKITDGSGLYALTSTAPQTEELYIKTEGVAGDYSKVITNIDCLGVDYNTNLEGWYGYQEAPLGVCVGRTQENSGISGELGDWVFHTVSSDEKNGITKLEELEGGTRPASNRIYVYNQNRKYRYYAQNSFKNNEWFKLLIYLADETGTKGLAVDAYASGKKGQDIVELYKEKIAAFDKAYRVEIIQRTPSKLTVEEVNNADLIYISDQEGIYGLFSAWNSIDTYLGGALPDKPDTVQFTDDFTSDTLMAIYDNCFYHEEEKTPTTALMIGNMANIWQSGINGSQTKNNMGKLSYFVDLFNDPADFAHFIEKYPENAIHRKNEDGYSMIHSSSSVTVYPNGKNSNVYNQGILNYEKYESAIYGQPVETATYDQWDWNYFMVYNLIDRDTWIEVRQESSQFSYKSLNGGFTADGVSAYKKDVQEGWTWFIPVTSGDNFTSFGKMLNIWKIMHNKTSKKSSSPKVIVTNPDYIREPDETNAATVYYIYIDEFMLNQADAFDIIYKAIWTPEEVTNPNALSSLWVERAEGGILQKQDSPSYETEYTYNVKGDFVNAEGAWNGVRSKQYLINATDEAGKTDTASVFVIFRDSFMLN